MDEWELCGIASGVLMPAKNTYPEPRQPRPQFVSAANASALMLNASSRKSADPGRKSHIPDLERCVV
jgi:hypothetical protein